MRKALVCKCLKGKVRKRKENRSTLDRLRAEVVVGFRRSRTVRDLSGRARRWSLAWQVEAAWARAGVEATESARAADERGLTTSAARRRRTWTEEATAALRGGRFRRAQPREERAREEMSRKHVVCQGFVLIFFTHFLSMGFFKMWLLLLLLLQKMSRKILKCMCPQKRKKWAEAKYEL